MEKDNVQQKDVEKNPMSPKTKKIIMFSSIGAGALILIIVALILILGATSKPSKSKAEEIAKSYVKAINEADGEKFEKLIDSKGYIIFKEEDLKKFDSKYKDKEKYIKKYLKDKDYDDLDEAEAKLKTEFESKYKYNSREYSVKEITSVEKSSKSKKVIVIKAKVKVKSTYLSSSDTKTLKLYVIKSSGKYKIVGAEID